MVSLVVLALVLRAELLWWEGVEVLARSCLVTFFPFILMLKNGELFSIILSKSIWNLFCSVFFFPPKENIFLMVPKENIEMLKWPNIPLWRLLKWKVIDNYECYEEE